MTGPKMRNASWKSLGWDRLDNVKWRLTVGAVYDTGPTVRIVAAVLLLGFLQTSQAFQTATGNTAALILQSNSTGPLTIDGLFYQTAQGRTVLPPALTAGLRTVSTTQWNGQTTMPDGRVVRLSVSPQGGNFNISLSARPNADITKWGIAVEAAADEYYTGLMERVVDGPQQASWAPGITTAMNLRGQKVEMIVKPTTSIYAPFYLSSRGYALFTKGDWPGAFDFAATRPDRVLVEFEGPSFDLKMYTAKDPAALVRAHAMEVGPPVLPPKWMYTPWRWRDEHTQRAAYYDGTPVTGPFNSEVMEDVLMMRAFGIPNGIYWIDRPWGPGRIGYDDFEIDDKRLPHFADMVKWLDAEHMKTFLWIAPFFNGKMQAEAIAKGYGLPGQTPTADGQNYPLVDFTNPAAKTYWQEGIAKLLKLGVAGFKLDRAEENIPESGPLKVFDERSIRENRNAYPAMYVKAAYEIAKKYRGDDFVVMPRAGYTGSAPYAVFWGGDIGGTQEGLRASIIAVQRSAVMGYPNWGSDTCGYNQQLMEQEVCGRWLAFSAFTPIMEVGPTRNVAFWNTPRDPKYDDILIALWRLYARVHDRLRDYSYTLAQEAHRTGMPMVRPVFLVDPKNRAAWDNWWTYLYGRDLLVSPVWEKGRRTQQVYLPAGERWRDAWNPDKVYSGGQTITAPAEPHQIPLFVRVGSNLKLGNLNQEWQESVSIARVKPDLKVLDNEVKAWFDRRGN
jgi:alpha-D-xyloside xylohydrolase